MAIDAIQEVLSPTILRLVQKYTFASAEVVPGNKLEIFCDGPENFSAILEAISCARKYVALEMYQFVADATGTEVRDALVSAARRGCRVRLMYDSIGSFSTSRSFFYPLFGAGGDVVEFRPYSPWRRRWGWRRRDHRKLLLVDEDLALIGGVNVSNAYKKPPEEGGYHDLMLSLRGPVVSKAWKIFDEHWATELEENRRRSTFSESSPPVQPQGEAVAQIIANNQFRNRWRIRRAILFAISRAEKTIDIMNPYFLPTAGLISALRRAVKRGVRVRLVVPARSDVPIVDLASLVAQRKLSARGVEVYRWPGILHAKAILIDERWLSIGSYNLDYLSLFYNLEIVANAIDENCSVRLADIFETDVGKSVSFHREQWEKMPWLTRRTASFLYRLRSFL